MRGRRALWATIGFPAIAIALVGLSAGVRSQDRSAANGADGRAERSAPREAGAPASATSVPGRGGKKGRRNRLSRKTSTVAVDEVARGPAVETFPVYGRIVATQSGVVATRAEGAVGQVLVRVGDRVRKGDVMIRLVSDMLASARDLKAAELSEYEAKTETAGVQVRLAQQELKRLERLRRSAAFSKARHADKRRDVERFKSVLAETRAKVEQARAQLKMAELTLEYAQIRAPFGGVVSQRHVEVGAYVDTGDKVVTLVNDRALEVEAEVPAARLKGLGPSTSVTVDPESGPSFLASVRAVLPVENPLARTRTVRFVPEFGRAAVSLAANQSVVIAVPTGPPREVVSVHKDAVLHRGGQPVVFVYQGGRAVLRQVRLGEALGTRFEVLGGVTPGDKAIVRGNERLEQGQTIELRNGDSAS